MREQRERQVVGQATGPFVDSPMGVNVTAPVGREEGIPSKKLSGCATEAAQGPKNYRVKGGAPASKTVAFVHPHEWNVDVVGRET